MTHYLSLLGLGFGDCGKGLFTDYLCRTGLHSAPAHTVVRFNGGAQAGHNVVLPDGRHHTFAQFGAGSLVPGVITVLAEPVVVHPGALLVEAARLQQHGVQLPLQQLLIDGRCRINTPFHQAAGRLRERLRQQDAHGSCGVGVGETVRDALAHPGQALQYADLRHPGQALAKLDAIRQRLLLDVMPMIADHVARPTSAQAAIEQELCLLQDPHMARKWLAHIGALIDQVGAASQQQIAHRLTQPGTVLFEGAQGVLLDEWRGFHPHTTWSTIHPKAVEGVLADLGIHRSSVQHLGILRSYPTRHGQGPFPTCDPALDILPEPHNPSDGWQGRFRRGHPDAVLLRYALAVCGQLDGVLLSHLDVFKRVPALRWCEAYRDTRATPMQAHHPTLLRELPLGRFQDLEHQAALTDLLHAAEPQYSAQALTNAPALLERIQSYCQVHLGSYGPTHADVHLMR